MKKWSYKKPAVKIKAKPKKRKGSGGSNRRGH